MKSGKASKQNQLLEALRTELQVKKKQSLELSITTQSLQAHNSNLKLQNLKLSQQLSHLRAQTDTLIDNQKFHISILETRTRQILKQKSDIEILYDTMKASYNGLASEFENYRVERELEIQELRQKNQEDMQSYQNSQAKYNSAVVEYEKLLKEICQLKEIRQGERQNFKAKLANIERQKIQSIDYIKKQMLDKACQMRDKAQQIRKQQLQVTTRLTFLQNDQLIRELEYQSCKTEQILRINTKLEAEVKELRRAIEIHKEVEKQLMKRNVGAKNVIASLAQEIKESKIRQEGQDQNEAVSPSVLPEKQKRVSKQKHLKQKPQSPPDSLTQQLHSIHKSAKQYEDIQTLRQYTKDLQQINQGQATQITQLKEKIRKLEEETVKLNHKLGVQKCDSIANLMLRFLQEIITPLRESGKDGGQRQDFDMEVLKNVHVEKWSVQNMQKIVKMILNELRPYLSLKLLKVPYFQACSQSKQKTLDYESLKQNLNVSKYLQALKRQKNRSLENIKSRSVTYIIEQSEKKQKYSHYRKLSSIRNINAKQQSLEPVARRFMKPHLLAKK